MSSPLSFQSEYNDFDQFKQVFSSKNLEALVRKTGFVERQRKFTAYLFAHLCIFFNGASAFATFEQMKGELLGFGVSMSVSSLWEKFNEKAANFMEALFGEVLLVQTARQRACPLLSRFTDIIIADSSVFNLHPKCAWHFSGSGGGASESAAKVQFSFGLLTSRVYELLLLEGTEGDAKHRFADVVRDALYIFDLGYFCAGNFKAIAEAGAYFLTRYRYGTAIYHPDGRAIGKDSLDRMVKNMRSGQILDMQVLMGAKKTPVRLVLHKLPEKVAAEIRRKLKTDKNKKCKSMSAGRLAFCDVNAYITNLSPVELPAHRLREVYSLRWQVEIMFKTWKSGLDMDKVRDIGPMQFRCMFFGKLIKMLLCFRIFRVHKHLLWNDKGIEISEIKGMSMIATLMPEIREWLVERKKKGQKLLSKIYLLLSKTCVKQAKKNDLNPFETILLYA